MPPITWPLIIRMIVRIVRNIFRRLNTETVDGTGVLYAFGIFIEDSSIGFAEVVDRNLWNWWI